MKCLTNLHKPALFLLLFSFVGVYAQQSSKPKPDRWFKREAFKDLDHFYLGAHIGVALPIVFQDRYDIFESTVTTSVGYEFTLNTVIPPHRLFAGYKYKRHYFELSTESKAFMLNHTTSDPYSGIQYSAPSLGYYISAGYNIDLLPKRNAFKINVGGSAGIFVLVNSKRSTPAMGINTMFELPCTRVFSLFFDIRYTIGFLVIGEDSEYYGIRIFSRLMSMDFNVGFRVNMFSKLNAEKGWKKYDELINK